MSLASQSSLTEAIAAARAGDRARARELLSKLLRADSANPEYWIWMSSVVESGREKVYCLESALKLDPSNRSALRGLVILGARSPEEDELASAIKIARRQTASAVVTRPAAPSGGFRFPWRLAVLIILGLFGVAALLQLLLLVAGPATTILAPVLAPVRTPTHTSAPATITLTVTLTPIPIETRIMRTPVPTELVQTPLAFLVESTSTPTTMLGVTPRPEYEAYANGLAALQRGDYVEAADSMREVVKAEPDAADAWYFLGEANRALDRPGAAVEAYDQAVLSHPEFAPAYLGRARTIQGLRPNTLAEDYARTIEADPLLAAAYLETAAFYNSRRQWENADELLGQAIEAGATEPELYIRRAEAQLNHTAYSDGLENAIEGSANDPTNLLGYLILGRAYVENELYNAALWPLQTYLLYEPDDPVGQATLARAHLGVGQYDSAFESANQALAMNDRLSQAYIVRGYVQNFRGEYDLALKDFSDALRLGRSSWDIQYGVARSYYGKREMAAAFEAANSALANAIEEEDRISRDRKQGESYALLGMIFEDFTPPAIDDALRQWQLLVSLEHAKPETIALAQTHILELTGRGPTRTATVSPTSSLTPGPTATRTPTPSRTPTP
ncbi:MAG TPA: tetratricopeptide repeat protein [Anaerolineales bacterium]|nr:tetratricopeptide repeat protein [Anaerolineales bacterium]